MLLRADANLRMVVSVAIGLIAAFVLSHYLFLLLGPWEARPTVVPPCKCASDGRPAEPRTPQPCLWGHGAEGRDQALRGGNGSLGLAASQSWIVAPDGGAESPEKSTGAVNAYTLPTYVGDAGMRVAGGGFTGKVALQPKPTSATARSIQTENSGFRGSGQEKTIQGGIMTRRSNFASGEGTGKTLTRMNLIITLVIEHAGFMREDEDSGSIKEELKLSTNKSAPQRANKVFSAAYVDLKGLPEKGHRSAVYTYNGPALPIVTWAESRSWFVNQFHWARLARDNTKNYWGDAIWRIGVHVRRGDRNIIRVSVLLNMLRCLLFAAPWIQARDTKIIVTAETSEDDPEFAVLKQLGPIELHIGTKTHSHAEKRLARDLDTFATSNIYIGTGAGSFTSIGGYIQEQGVAFIARKEYEMSMDSQNPWFATDDYGYFPCKFDLSMLWDHGVKHGAETGDFGIHDAYTSKAKMGHFFNVVEQAFTDMDKLYRKNAKCYECGLKMGRLARECGCKPLPPHLDLADLKTCAEAGQPVPPVGPWNHLEKPRS